MKLFITAAILFLPNLIFPQQVADTSYNPIIKKPQYETEKGPIIYIDEGHYNFHTKNGRYKPFAKLLERDGYQVKEFKGLIKDSKLKKGKIIVISNPLNKKNVEDWFLPNPSAFKNSEIETLRKWVLNGGSLFLIADHMPMAGASKDLAKVFGFQFTNGFVFDTLSRGPSIFKTNENTLIESAITKGCDSTESIVKVATFTGQAFQIPDDAIPILTLNKKYVNFIPDTAWVFNNKTKKFNIEGWSQGAYKEYGKGRIVVFGEAAMFTAQLAGPEKIKIGMNSQVASENHQLLLNIIHWLDRKI